MGEKKKDVSRWRYYKLISPQFSLYIILRIISCFLLMRRHKPIPAEFPLSLLLSSTSCGWAISYLREFYFPPWELHGQLITSTLMQGKMAGVKYIFANPQRHTTALLFNLWAARFDSPPPSNSCALTIGAQWLLCNAPTVVFVNFWLQNKPSKYGFLPFLLSVSVHFAQRKQL